MFRKFVLEPPKTEAKNPKSENEGVKASTICPIEINIPPPCPEETNPPPPPCPPETKPQSIYEACPVLPHSCPPPQLSPGKMLLGIRLGQQSRLNYCF